MKELTKKEKEELLKWKRGVKNLFFNSNKNFSFCLYKNSKTF